MPARSRERPAEAPVVIDCLTLWLSNLMLGGHDVDSCRLRPRGSAAGANRADHRGSNEVGLGIVPETPLGRDFRDKAGVLNQRIAARAGHVVFMVAGLPMTVKPSQ